MIDLSAFIDKLNISFSITSLDIFSITYTNDIESFINSMIKKFPNVKINLYLNMEKNFKDFIHINNIFNKLMYISNIDNINLYQTELTDRIIMINKDPANTFCLNTLLKYNNIDNKVYEYKPFNLNLLAKIYTLYVRKKINIFDNEFKSYFNKNNIININPVNIPQFSSFKNACYSSVKEIYKNDNITYIELGKLIYPEGDDNEIAQKKYGENHGKLTNLLDFSSINSGRIKSFSITPLGKLYVSLNETEKEKLLKFQFYKLFIVQYIINNNISTKNELLDCLLYANLSLSTAKRRLSNVNSIIDFLEINDTSLSRK